MTPGGAEGAAVAAMIQAVKASGTIVRVAPEEMQRLLARAERPLVVTSTQWLFGRRYVYLTSYRGLAFCTTSRDPLQLSGCEVVEARRIWVPQ
jgi:hypothetical protein